MAILKVLQVEWWPVIVPKAGEYEIECTDAEIEETRRLFRDFYAWQRKMAPRLGVIFDGFTEGGGEEDDFT